MLYATIESITEPAVHTVGTAYMAYANGLIHDSKDLSYIFLCLFIAMYGLCTILLALHFIFRYVLICR
ncbi:hypothetical protein ANCDUO_21712 [Ancylostoma duodenale]|uniref:Uncharacterized protein n=1 Tax=Ancylostoma duodenale TaxID=51022 RepID=A0A0C2FTI1_9BILA|nr:hypothetical protein ANCDUO_21712 [Ancylostoma duodenale]